MPNNFPTLHELTGEFSSSNRRRANDFKNIGFDFPSTSANRHQRQRRKLLIALQPDYVQNQHLLSERL